MNEPLKNTIREELEPTLKEPQRAAKRPKHIPRNAFTLFLKGELVSEERVMSWLPFIFFLGCLTLVYISNRHYAERNIRAIDKANNQLKELRWEYMTTKADLMFLSKQTEVADKVAKQGLKESIEPPKKITVGKNED